MRVLILDMAGKKATFTPEEFAKIRAGFERDGAVDAGRASLERRFTEPELSALVNMVWFSPHMQSIRRRIGDLEKSLNFKFKEEDDGKN